jgi:ABC-type multidrug transport system permease subunit
MTGASGGGTDLIAGQGAKGPSAVKVISPDRGWFDWRLRQLWRYRDLIGLFVWRDFVLLGKVYFHRLVIPVSLVLSNLIAFGIQVGILLVVMAVYRFSGTFIHLTGWILLAPLLLLILAGYALGGGIIICALTTRYRDLSYLVTFGVQLLMYLTPVIYPLSAVPPRYQWIAKLNPLAPVFEGFRRGFLGCWHGTGLPPADAMR